MFSLDIQQGRSNPEHRFSPPLPFCPSCAHLSPSPDPPMASSTTHIMLGAGNVKKMAKERGVAITDGNKSRDNTTTLFKVKNKEGKRMVVQFGKSMEDWVDCALVSYTDANDSSLTKRIVFANLEKDKKIEEDLEAFHKEIGKRLFDGREAYWNGRVSDEMRLEEFMTRRSTMIKSNRLTGNKEALLKCRGATKVTAASKFWLVSDLEKNDSGKWSATRRPISKVNGSARQFKGIICCDVGVYIGWDKGPKWGIFLTVTEGNLIPIDPAAGASMAEQPAADMFGTSFTTDEASPMVLDAVEGDHVQTESDLETAEDGPSKKRARA